MNSLYIGIPALSEVNIVLDKIPTLAYCGSIMGKSDSENLVLIAGKVQPKTRDEVRRLALLDDRPVSAMVRRLIEIGLSVERTRFENATRGAQFISRAS